MNRLIATLERRVELEKLRDRAGGELDRARAGLAPFTVQRGEAREAGARFNEALGKVYGDCVSARRAIRAFAQREPLGAAAREIASRPERSGELRGTDHGPIRSVERTKAVQQAKKLSRAAEDYLRNVGVAREHRPEYRRARAAMVQAEVKVRKLDAKLERGRRSSGYESGRRYGRSTRRYDGR